LHCSPRLSSWITGKGGKETEGPDWEGRGHGWVRAIPRAKIPAMTLVQWTGLLRPIRPLVPVRNLATGGTYDYHLAKFGSGTPSDLGVTASQAWTMKIDAKGNDENYKGSWICVLNYSRV